jgi:CubicO group peptidase (beta-lactamase class C family)
MQKIGTLLLCLTALLPAAGGLVHAQESAATALDSIAAGYQRERGFMGAVLVAKDGKIVLEKGYGLANLEWDVPNTPDTKFRLGSITKQFTATAVLQLEEQGKLSLSDPISKYIPDCPEAWKAITVHHLMNHTSGIPSYTSFPDFGTPKFHRVPMSPLEIAMLSKDKPLEFQPGEGWRYNNTGYVLLGHIIEKASGMKYDAYLKQHVFEPLGLKDTGYDWTEPVMKRRASGYGYDAGQKSYRNGEFLDMSLPHAAGSLYSTVRDLFLWDRALAAGKLLKKETYTRMFTPGRSNYGFGWMITTDNGRARIGHGGGIHGFSTIINRYPEHDAVVIVLSNVQNGQAGVVGAKLANALFGEKVELPWERKAITLDSKIYERYVGEYQMPQFRVTVAVEGGKLTLARAGQPSRQMSAESETRFFVSSMDGTFEFIPGPDGKASELVLRNGGNDTRGKRVQP